jgi:putative transposase
LRGLIDAGHASLSIRRQCELLGLNRSTWHYQGAEEAEQNLWLMRLIDEQYLETPFYGSRRMTVCLNRAGHAVNRKRVQRLMRRMGIEAIYPRPQTTRRNPEHRVFPYLLRGLQIVQPCQVWSTDITYVPLPRGSMFLTAVIDWYSRYVLSWRLSNSLEGTFCLEALDDALQRGRPQIFNTDQGSQYTALAFTARLQQAGVAISMDGRGRALDNVFVERLWRSVKYECLYLHGFLTVEQLQRGLSCYFDFYNRARPHQALDYRTPEEVHEQATHNR